MVMSSLVIWNAAKAIMANDVGNIALMMEVVGSAGEKAALIEL